MRIGIIGGSGLGQTLGKQVQGNAQRVETPFGWPSAPILTGEWHQAPIAFLPRHGNGHIFSPSAVPYRANIYALKQLGCTHIIASGAVGSLRDEIAPKQLVVIDQVIDKTHKRPNTFFDEYLAAHAEFADPFCPNLRRHIIEVAKTLDCEVHGKGTYVCMEGPQFSTRAESLMHRQWGGDVIGMTIMPEAKLAREAEMCYAVVALSTDYDCWRPHQAGDRLQLLQEIISNMNTASESATQLIAQTVAAMAQESPTECECHRAMELAIWSDKSKIDPAARAKYGILVKKHLS